MKKMRCVVVDDEPLARRGLIGMLEKNPMVEVIGEANSPEEWKRACDILQPDVVFMDILLRDENIMDHMHESLVKPMMIVTTAYPQFALRGYEFSVLDYLLKPISGKDLERSVWRAYKAFTTTEVSKKEDIYLRINGKYYRLFYKEILFLEGMENYVVIHTENQRLVCKSTMSSMEKHLPSDQFVRVHRSYIVNKLKVDLIDKLNVVLRDHTLPISRENRSLVYEKLMQGRDIRED